MSYQYGLANKELQDLVVNTKLYTTRQFSSHVGVKHFQVKQVCYTLVSIVFAYNNCVLILEDYYGENI